MGRTYIHPLSDDRETMPSNLDTEQRRAAALARNPTTTSSWLVSTFGGWLVRQALKLSTAASAVAAAWVASRWVALEQLASQAGADAQTLVDLHAQGATLASAAGAIVATLITGAAEAALSRAAAKVAEQPRAPKALPL